MPIELSMPMITALHPRLDAKGNPYTDNPDVVVFIPEPHTQESLDGIHLFRNHTVRERHSHGIQKHTFHRDLSVHFKENASTKKRVSTEFGIGATLDTRLTKDSFRAVLKEVPKKDREAVLGVMAESIADINAYLLCGSAHAILVSGPIDGSQKSRMFEWNRDGYSISESYCKPEKMILDSKKKVEGDNPYYISALDGTPSVRNPHTIEMSFDIVHYKNMRIGMFAGVRITAPWEQVSRAFASSGLAKKVVDGSIRSSDIPNIVTPLFSAYIIPNDK